MTSKVVRKNITLPSEKLLEEFQKFQNRAGYSTFSHMVSDSIIKNMKNYKGKSKEIENLEDKIDFLQDALIRNFDLVNQREDLMLMRLNKEDLGLKVGHALDDILKLLKKRDEDYSSILRKCKKYDKKTLNAALSLLVDANRIGTINKKSKRKNNGGKE
jgi:hypothetical protein